MNLTDTIAEQDFRKPNAINYIFAHPVILACAIGTAVLIAGIYFGVLDNESRATLPMALLSFLLNSPVGTIAAFLLLLIFGYFLVAFSIGPLLLWSSRKINGSPISRGDLVFILTGKYKGKIAKVYETSIGQGGGTVVWLDMDKERKKKALDDYHNSGAADSFDRKKTADKVLKSSTEIFLSKCYHTFCEYYEEYQVKRAVHCCNP